MSKHLNLSIDTFKEKVNEVFAELESELKITEISAADKTHSRTAKINDKLVYALRCVPKRRIIISFTLIGTGDGSLKSGIDIFNAIYATIAVVSGMEKEEMSKVVINLISQTKPDTIEIGGVKYTLTRDNKIGAWLSVEVVTKKESKNEQK